MKLDELFGVDTSIVASMLVCFFGGALLGYVVSRAKQEPESWDDDDSSTDVLILKEEAKPRNEPRRSLVVGQMSTRALDGAKSVRSLSGVMAMDQHHAPAQSNGAIPTSVISHSNGAHQVVEENQKAVAMVVQRFRYGRILLHDNRSERTLHNIAYLGSTKSVIDPVTFESSIREGRSEVPSPGGLVVYVSFSQTATADKVEQAAKTLLNLPVMTTGQWGDGNKTVGLLPLAYEIYAEQQRSKRDPGGDENGDGVTLVIIPQANLISKVKNNGKSIQYRDQIDKSNGEKLYASFVQALTRLSLEYFESSGNEFGTGRPKAALSVDRSVPPYQMFRTPEYEKLYSDWDEATGLPISDADGNPLTKSALKRVRKLYDTQTRRYAKFMERSREDILIQETEAKMDHEVDPASLDPEYLRIVAGTFGKRQALELTADMGPFCHVVDVA